MNSNDNESSGGHFWTQTTSPLIDTGMVFVIDPDRPEDEPRVGFIVPGSYTFVPAGAEANSSWTCLVRWYGEERLQARNPITLTVIDDVDDYLEGDDAGEGDPDEYDDEEEERDE